MDIKSVQQTLSDLGLLNPRQTEYGAVALGIVTGGIVQPEAVTSPAVEARHRHRVVALFGTHRQTLVTG